MIHALVNLVARLSFFARVGGLSGAIVGCFFFLSQLLVPNIGWLEVFEAGLLLSLFAWLCMLLFFGIWLRYTVRQIWFQTLIVVLLTGFTTVCVLYLWQTRFAGLVGFIIGIIIGTLLTMLCKWLYGKLEVKA